MDGFKKKTAIGLSLAILLVSIPMVLPTGILTAKADATTQNNALRIVSQYQGVFNTVPTWSNTQETSDCPLMGNGDVGVAVKNNIDTMTFILDKNEFWSLNDGKKTTMAAMSLAIPGMSSASYHMTEDIALGEVNGTFTKSGNTITTKSWVQADDTSNNRFMTEFTYTGTGTQAVTVALAPGAGNSTYGSTLGSSADMIYADVRGDTANTVNGVTTEQARIASRVIGTTGTISNNQLSFTLSPGTTYTLITSIISNTDSSSFQSTALSDISSKTQTDVNNYLTAHHTWWNNFYSKSFIEIPDKTVEKEYYGSLYLLGSSSRAGEASPGLWGPWNEADGAWNGDYTLNYNYETPFYASFPTNHVELASCYDAPVVNWLPKAETEATSDGWTGAFYRIHIGPLPNGSVDTSTHNQKSAGAYAATDMIMHYYYTKDTTYANTIYPTLKQLATFWQNYLSWNGTSYDIVNDAQQEDDADPQTNGVMSLGLVRYLLQGTIDISTALNVDSTLRATWQNDLNNLSPFPTFTRNSQTVFRWTSVGRDWCVGNSIGTQLIYPAMQIGLKSSSTLLSTANNMITQVANWNDGNGSDTFYPAAAQVGYNPSTILSNLDSFINSQAYPNLFIHTSGGGMENLNTVPSTVSAMLMQSFQGEILPFADWPSGTNAKFGDQLAQGNFLVSSDIRSNVVQYLRVISNVGGNFTFKNPWPGQTLVEYKNGVANGTVSGTDITVSSAANDIFHFAPNGTSYATILNEMNLPLGSTMGGGSGTEVNLSSSFNEAGFTTLSDPSNGSYGGGGWTMAAELVSPTPTYSGISFNLGPITTDGAKNSIDGTGQTISLTQGVYSHIWFLGSGTNGSQTGTFQINYTDGTNSTASITENDWCTSASNAAETMADRHSTTGDNATTNYIFAYSLTPTAGKTVSSIMLPSNANMHVFAITNVS